MEGLVRLVAESLARHGMNLPPARLEWSDWKPLESSLCLTAPSYPGLFAIAERVAEHNVVTAPESIPHFAIFHEGHTQDLGFEMGRLCSPYSLLRDRISNRDCWVRYAAMPFSIAQDSGLAESRKPIADSQACPDSPQALEMPTHETEIPIPLPSGF